jgi:TonB family protein
MALFDALHRREYRLRLRRRMGPARLRMLWAVAASAMIHVWVVENMPPGTTRVRPPVLPPPLQARLMDGGGDRSVPITALQREIEEASAGPVIASAIGARRPGNDQPPAREPSPAPPQPLSDAAPGQEQPHLTPAPLDPVYYSARELDVYPTPLAPLRFEYPAHLAHAPIAGNVLVTVMVGESGAVDGVALVTAEPAGYFEEHTRAALTSARFHPGRKAGRVVRSRITVSVEYDPAARAAAAR